MTPRDLSTVARKLDPLIRRLGSDHPGEVTATVAALKRVLASADRDLHDLADAINRPLQAPSSRVASPPTDVADWHQLIVQLLQWPGLTSWEREFLHSIRGFRWLSQRQQGVLRRIHDAWAGRRA